MGADASVDLGHGVPGVRSGLHQARLSDHRIDAVLAGLWRLCGVCFVPAQAPARRSKACASASSCWNGRADAMLTTTRRTLTRTSAPISNSYNRIVPQVAVANWVCANPTRRSTQIGT